MEHCHSRQSAIRVRAGSFSFCILRNNCGPAYGRDFIDRPARPCGFGRICNLSGSLNRWSSRVSQILQDATRDLSKLFRSFRSAVRHADEPKRRRIPDERKSGARALAKSILIFIGRILIASGSVTEAAGTKLIVWTEGQPHTPADLMDGQGPL